MLGILGMLGMMGMLGVTLAAGGCTRPVGIGDGDGDGGPPVDGQANTPPTVTCPEEVYATPSDPAVLVGMGEDDRGIIGWRWEVLEKPLESQATCDPTDSQVTQLTPDVDGDYTVQLTAEDTQGLTASCETVVHGVIGEPEVVCPDDLEALVGETVALEGEAYDEGSVVWVRWEVLSRPQGSSAQVQNPNAYATTMVPDVSGVYTLRFTARDDEGNEGSCEFTLAVGSPPTAICPEATTFPTRQPFALEGDAQDDGVIVSWSWEVLSHDTDTDPLLENATSQTANLTAYRVGHYTLRLTVTDDDGLTDSCELTLQATPTPPTAICPVDVDAVPLTPVELIADAEDDGTVVAWFWELVQTPPGSSALPPSPPDGAVTSFTPDIVGVYVLRLTVTDDSGDTDSCEFSVFASPGEGLRVEMFWNPPEQAADWSDVDLHLLHPSSPAWFDWNGDCYYANCDTSAGFNLEWDQPNYNPDNPRLDLDDTQGYGPENINIDEPLTGHTYTIGVHYFNDSGWGPAEVYIKIYCGDINTDPIYEYGPMTIDVGSTDELNDFWKVADVEWNGFDCDVTPINTVVTAQDARTSR